MNGGRSGCSPRSAINALPTLPTPLCSGRNSRGRRPAAISSRKKRTRCSAICRLAGSGGRGAGRVLGASVSTTAMILAGSTVAYGRPMRSSGWRIGRGSRCGGSGSRRMSLSSQTRFGCRRLISMMTLSAIFRKVGPLPIAVVKKTRPSSLTSLASITATSTLPKKPSSSCCEQWDRCSSWNSMRPSLIAARQAPSDWNGMRKLTASASARSTSPAGPASAPARTRTWKGSPASWRARARSASARVTACGTPGSVKPPMPRVAPSGISSAASSAVSTGKSPIAMFVTLL